MKVTLTDEYSGRSLTLRVSEKMWANVETFGAYSFLTDHQRKRAEYFFGKIAAYHTTITAN